MSDVDCTIKKSDNLHYFAYSKSMYDVQDKISQITEDFADFPANAEKKLLQIIKKYPFAFDAYYYLGYHYFWQKKTTKSITLLEKGLSEAQKLFPKKLDIKKDQLHWGFIENRPFLRMFFQLGLCNMNHSISQSIKIFEDMISLNPDDNQGARALLMQCYFENNDMASAISLCKKYPDDTTPAISFGYVLALYNTKDIIKSKREGIEAIKWNDMVAKEITKKHHKLIDSNRPEFVESGSAHEAYIYWGEFGKYWSQDAVNMVASCMQESLR